MSDKQKIRLIDAHSAINNAFIDTDNDTFHRSPQATYITNSELARSWNHAASQVMLLDKNLGEILYNKSRFRNNPKLFVDLGRKDEIIELGQVIDELERLRIRI